MPRGKNHVSVTFRKELYDNLSNTYEANKGQLAARGITSVTGFITMLAFNGLKAYSQETTEKEIKKAMKELGLGDHLESHTLEDLEK